MANTLESLKELTSWEEYLAFMKEGLKQLSDGDTPFYLSKEKVEFEIDGKPWKGFAVLVGPKGDACVKKLKKDGVQFREATCRRDGKKLRVDGMPTAQSKLAEVTLKKLRLGYSIAGAEDVAEVDGAELKKRLDALFEGIRKNSGLVDDDPALAKLLDDATRKASDAEKALKSSDLAGAETLIAEGERFLGTAIVGFLEDGEPKAGGAELKKRLDALFEGIRKNTGLVDDDPALAKHLDDATRRASDAEKALNKSDLAGAEKLIAEGQEFLGRAIGGFLEDGPPAAPKAGAAELEARRQEFVAELKDAAALKVPENEAVLKKAANKAREVEASLGKKDFAGAEKQLDEIEDMLSEVVEDGDDDAEGDGELPGLGDWKKYRSSVKANLKLLPEEGGPVFISRKKVDFQIRGKTFKGLVVLLGQKARMTVLALKKDGIVFKEGTGQKDGRKILVGGIKSTVVKEAAKTFLKLRLGRKLLFTGNEPEGDADDATAEGAAPGEGTGEESSDGAQGMASAAAGATATLSKALVRKVQDVADALVKLRAAADALKKAKLSDEPYRGDFTKLTNELGKITQAAASEKQKESQLKKLKATVIEKTMDASVANLDPNDPKTGPLIEKQIKARFGVDFKFREEKSSGGTKKADPKKEGETLKSLYLTLAKAPVFPKDKLKNIELTLKPAAADSEGGVYYEDDKKAGIDCKRPKDSLDYNTQLGSPAYFPDGVDENCKPANNKPVAYFNWATLHEVAHAVDAKNNFMNSKGKGTKYGGWTEYGNNVGPIATVVSKAFGTGLTGPDLTALEAYALALMKNKTPKAARSPAENSKRGDVKTWVDAVRVGNSIWWDGPACNNLAIGGIVYQEAYDFGGGWWNSYELAARKQGIHGYQFRAPGEWFAELYAAYYCEKLKPSHPFVPDLKSLEK